MTRMARECGVVIIGVLAAGCYGPEPPPVPVAVSEVAMPRQLERPTLDVEGCRDHLSPLRVLPDSPLMTSVATVESIRIAFQRAGFRLAFLAIDPLNRPGFFGGHFG